MVLNDGTFLYNEYTVKEYLEALGFDMQELMNMLAGDIIQERDENEAMWREEERYRFCVEEHMSTAWNELDDIADDLASGKGGTKVQYAQKIKDCINFWLT